MKPSRWVMGTLKRPTTDRQYTEAVLEQNVLSGTEVPLLYERSLRELIVAGDIASKDSRRQRALHFAAQKEATLAV